MPTHALTAPADGTYCTNHSHDLAVTILDGIRVCGPCMRSRTGVHPDPHPGGINLDPASVRAEIADAAWIRGANYSPGQVMHVTDTDDHTISVAIRETVTEDFWAAFDHARSKAIDYLLNQRSAPARTNRRG